jgi:hypothetical protein
VPRLTVIEAERIYKDEPARFSADPGAYRSAADFCRRCWRHIDVEILAYRHRISSDFAAEQLAGIAEAEGHLDDCHPDYDGGGYNCCQCRRPLSEAEDG